MNAPLTPAPGKSESFLGGTFWVSEKPVSLSYLQAKDCFLAARDLSMQYR